MMVCLHPNNVQRDFDETPSVRWPAADRGGGLTPMKRSIVIAWALRRLRFPVMRSNLALGRRTGLDIDRADRRGLPRKALAGPSRSDPQSHRPAHRALPSPRPQPRGARIRCGLGDL